MASTFVSSPESDLEWPELHSLQLVSGGGELDHGGGGGGGDGELDHGGGGDDDGEGGDDGDGDWTCGEGPGW